MTREIQKGFAVAPGTNHRAKTCPTTVSEPTVAHSTAKAIGDFEILYRIMLTHAVLELTVTLSIAKAVGTFRPTEGASSSKPGQRALEICQTATGPSPPDKRYVVMTCCLQTENHTTYPTFLKSQACVFRVGFA